MDHDIELRFQKLQKHLEKDFGPGMDMSTFLFLVGVNELGMGHQTFSKQQKMELMHIIMIKSWHCIQECIDIIIQLL